MTTSYGSSSGNNYRSSRTGAASSGTTARPSRRTIVAIIIIIIIRLYWMLVWDHHHRHLQGEEIIRIGMEMERREYNRRKPYKPITAADAVVHGSKMDMGRD